MIVKVYFETIKGSYAEEIATFTDEEYFDACYPILENLFDEVLEQYEKGLLNDQVNEIAREQGLHVDDDRDEILEIITNRIFEEESE